MRAVIGGRPASKTWNDEVLAGKAVSGDADAWHALVDRYSAYVFTLLRSARVPADDQPDAFQYVFVELFKALPKIENRSNLAPWIRQTAIRHAVRLRRKQAETEPLGDSEPGFQETIQEDLEAAERALRIREAVETLKEQCRTLIHMLFFEEPARPYAETAEALGIKIGSIGQIRQRCLEALAKALKARGID